MADISLCAIAGALDKCETCYRNPAITEPGEVWQSWIDPSVQNGDCEYYAHAQLMGFADEIGADKERFAEWIKEATRGNP